jgi:hypothetical protein
MLGVLALALAVIVAGITVVQRRTITSMGRTPRARRCLTPHKSVRHQRLSPQRIPSLGCGPLTEQAADHASHREAGDGPRDASMNFARPPLTALVATRGCRGRNRPRDPPPEMG